MELFMRKFGGDMETDSDGTSSSTQELSDEGTQATLDRNDSLLGKVDSIAEKYFSVWIWSVVVGVISTNSISIVGYYPQSKGSDLALLSAPILLLSCLFTMTAWFMTANFLTRYLVPIFFYGDRPDPRSARYLANSVRFSIFGVVFRLLLAVLDLVFNSLQRSF